MSRPIGPASALEQRRGQAVLAGQKGDEVKDVARIMGVTPRSLHRWLQNAKNPDGLAAKPQVHPTRLSVSQQQELEQLLLQGAQAHGWPNQLWTTQRIADLIRRHFGVSLHRGPERPCWRHRGRWRPEKTCRPS